jgi:type VI protein secretion system component Hcp
LPDQILLRYDLVSLNEHHFINVFYHLHQRGSPMRLLPKVLFFFLFLAFVIPAILQAEVIGYLQVDSVQGESTHPTYTNWIEIHGFGQGMQSTGATLGVPDVGNIRLTKALDITSPQLYERLVTGVLIPNVTLQLVSATGENHFEIQMTDVIIKSIVPSVGSVAATEILSLAPAKIRWTAKSEGAADRVFAWDIENSEPW